MGPAVPTTFSLSGGQVPPGSSLVGNDCYSPSGTYYRMTAIGLDGVRYLSKNVLVTGATADIGNLPSPATGGGGGGSGSVTSVATGTGLTGGPITSSGTIALATPVDVANGGTGAADAATARANLGAAGSATTISAGTGLTGGGDLSANRTVSLSVPVSTANGGTGAITPSAALSNLGGVPTTRTISTTAPLSGGGDLSANRTLAISPCVASGASHAAGAVPDPGSVAGTTKFLREDCTFAAPPAGTVTTVSSGGLSPLFTASVANPTTTPALSFSLSTAGAHAFLGNNTGGVAAPAYVQPAFADLSGGLACAQFPALTGNVTTTAGSCATAIGAGVVSDSMLSGGITLAHLAAQAANTVVANVTGSSASPTAVAIPNCTDTGGQHLNYTAGTGFGCGTTGGGGGSGTVTSITAGTGLSASPSSPITTTGTLAIANTAVTPASYTNANITVNAQGQITAASNGTTGTAADMLAGNSNNATVAAGTTVFFPAVGSFTGVTTEAVAGTRNLTSRAGTLKNFRVEASAAPGAGARTFTYTVMLNGVASAITCSINSSSITTCSDLTHTVAVSAGDEIGVQITTTSTAAVAKHSWSLENEYSTGGGGGGGSSPPFADSTALVANATDPTKLGAFDAGGITTATTRTYTLPDLNGTMALTSSNVASATALAATPTNCGAGVAATGVDASGNAVGCFTPSGSGTVTNTGGALALNQVVLGAGGSDTKTLGSLGTTSTVLHGNAAGGPTFSAVALGTDVSGTLAAAQFPALTGDTTTTAGSLATTTTKLNGTTPGGTCTNQFVRSLSGSAVPTCATVGQADTTNGYVDLSTAQSSIGGAKTFTAALTAPVQDKNGQVLNVKAYGALGDGTTDDATAIAATITAAPAGSTIYFPPGTYIVGTMLNVSTASLRFEGAGWGSVLKAKNSAALAAIVGISASNVSFHALKFDGNRANAGTTTSGAKLLSFTGSHEIVSSCEITASADYGVAFQPPDPTTATLDEKVLYCYVHDNGGSTATNFSTGIAAFNNSTNTITSFLVEGCWIELNYSTFAAASPNGSGIGLDANDVRIIGNHLKNNYNGGGQVVQSGTNGTKRNWLVEGNVFEVTNEASVSGSTLSGIEFVGEQLVVSGNYFSGGKGSGVAIEPITTVDTTDYVITNNTFDSMAGGVGFLNGTSGGGKRVLIGDNTFISCTTGINVTSLAASVDIHDNTFTGCTTNIADATSQATMSGNLPVAGSGVFTRAPGAGLFYSNTTISSAIANTTTQTAFSKSFTLPAGALNYPGATIRVAAAGLYSTSGAPSLTLATEIGSGLTTSSVMTSPSGASNFQWSLETSSNTLTTGSSGTLRTGAGHVGLNPSVMVATGGGGPVTVNLTTTQTVQILVTWGTASPSNTITLTSLQVWIDYPGTTN